MYTDKKFLANMKCSILISVVLQILWVESVFLPQSVEDHYWRDFNGLVPSDAIPGGTNEKGDNTFIGQFSVIYPGPPPQKVETIPGTITKGSPIVQGGYWGSVKNSTDGSNVKVLSSSYNIRYKWYSPTTQVSPRCRYVIGGYEQNVPLYLGKAKIDTQNVVGKIFSNRNPMKLIAAVNGKEMSFETFTVLTYCY